MLSTEFWFNQLLAGLPHRHGDSLQYGQPDDHHEVLGGKQQRGQKSVQVITAAYIASFMNKNK